MRVQPVSGASALAALSISALWGGNVVALKIGLATFPPFWSAFWRMLLGVAVVGLWASSRGIQLAPPREERRVLGELGLVFTIQIATLNFGVDLTSPAFAVVLLNSYPIFTNFIGHFFVPEDRLSWRRIFGLAIAFGGICLVFLGKPAPQLASRPILGNLISTAAAALLGARSVFTQRVVQTVPPVRAVFWQMAISLPFFVSAGALWEKPLLQPVGAGALLAIVYQGAVVAGICFIAWTTLLTRMSPGVLSIFAFLTPIFGVLASAWLYGEHLSARLLIGLAAVTAGILIVTLQRRGQGVPAPAAGLRGAAR